MSKSSTHEPLENLVTLVSRDDADIRPTLLRAITELYVQKPTHTVDEQNQYTELALGLLTSVDAQTRAAVEACLCDYPAAPPEVLWKLAQNETGEIRPESSSSPVSLNNYDLIELFFTANSEERRLILINLEVAVPKSALSLRAPADASTHLERALMHQDVNEFIRVLERIMGVSRSLAERIVNDVGEPLVVVGKALGIKSSVLQRILLALNPGMGKAAIRMLALMQLFEEIPTQVAIYMVSLWQRSNERMTPSYESLHWNDEQRDARSLANPGPHSTTRDRHTQPGRFKVNSR
jgi:hypothetical protein